MRIGRLDAMGLETKMQDDEIRRGIVIGRLGVRGKAELKWKSVMAPNE